jgi:hypothetical protein
MSADSDDERERCDAVNNQMFGFHYIARLMVQARARRLPKGDGGYLIGLSRTLAVVEGGNTRS